MGLSGVEASRNVFSVANPPGLLHDMLDIKSRYLYNVLLPSTNYGNFNASHDLIGQTTLKSAMADIVYLSISQ